MSDDEKNTEIEFEERGFEKKIQEEDLSYETVDVEKANLEYYEEQQEKNCCRRMIAEFCLHPYTVLEGSGRVIDVPRSFAPQPWYITFPLKCIPLGIALDTMIRDLVFYDGDVGFYWAYFENWCLILNILYLLISASTSMLFCFKPQQPFPGYNRAPCHVCVMWGLFPVAVVNSILSLFLYWILVADNEDGNPSSDIDYFSISKHVVIPLLLLLEGQVLNRIPIRFSHLVWSQIFTILYMIWTMFHSITDIGNPDADPEVAITTMMLGVSFSGATYDDYRDMPIYSFLDWNDPEKKGWSAFGCAMAIGVVAPIIFIILYLLSWPYRRYCDLGDERDDDDMPNEVNLALSVGPLGMSFAPGEPPILGVLKEDSPYAQDVVEGMAVDTFTDANGVVYYKLSSDELIEHLTNSADDEGRTLRFIHPGRMELTEPDDAVVVTLPPGRVGVVFDDTPPMIMRIADDSPLLGEVQEGMVADTLELEDGTKMYEMTASDFVAALTGNADSEGRTVRFINPETQQLTPDPGSGGDMAGAGEAVEIVLPSGSAGLVFSKGSPPEVKKIKETSPLVDCGIMEGMLVDTLELEDGSKFYKMDGKELTGYLKSNKDSEGRLVRFIMPGVELTEPPMDDGMNMPDELEVTLPSGKIGLILDGEPPQILDMHEESPLLVEGVVIGMVVDTLELEDGSKFYEMETSQFQGLLADNAESEERKVRFINPTTMELTPPEDMFGAAEDTQEMPDELELLLPVGKLGINFKGEPPEVVAINPESPLIDEGLIEGMVVDTLTLEDGQVMQELSSDSLRDALMDNADSDGRIIRFVNPAIMGFTLAAMAGEETTPEMEMPDEIEVMLPSGRVGIKMEGIPPELVAISPESPIVDEVVEGMVADTLTLEDGKVMYEMSTDDLQDALVDNADSEGRIIRFINPATRELTPAPDEEPEEEPAELEIPDEKEVFLPSGKLGLMLQGSPPEITGISPESPIADEVMEGMVVDTLTLEDGQVVYEMETDMFTAILRENEDSEGRLVRFINPATMELTPAPPVPDEVVFEDKPDTMDIELPPGRLGVSFHMVDGCVCVKNTKEDSPLAGVELDGYGINTLTVGERLPYMELDAQELTDILKESKDEPYRVMNFMKLSLAHQFDMIPEEEIVSVPAGKLGVNFEGDPPKPKSFKPSSPVEQLFPTKMYVDEVQLPNGYSKTGLQIQDIIDFLQGNMDEEGRVLVFKKEGIPPSPPSEYMPGMSPGASYASGSVGGSRASGSQASGSQASRSRASGSRASGSRASGSRASRSGGGSRASRSVPGSILGGIGFDEHDEEVKEYLSGMGFAGDAIEESINYFKAIGEPVNADGCMTRIISEGE